MDSAQLQQGGEDTGRIRELYMRCKVSHYKFFPLGARPL